MDAFLKSLLSNYFQIDLIAPSIHSSIKLPGGFMTNAINWFEIPVKNFDRAKTFYENILGAKIEVMPHPQLKYGMLPYDMSREGVGGGIVQGDGYDPSNKGSLLYLNGGEDLSVPLSKVEIAGGKVLLPKTSLGPNGFMAQFEDTEGNKLAFHSPK
jgi:predicted enzyme related to lactoylglutathione lyase